MKKLKIILLFSILLIRIPFILDIKSKYRDETKIEGIIDYYKIDGNQLSIEIIGKERVIANYYIKDEKEKKYYEDTLELGLTIIATGNLKKPSSNRNFNLFNYKKYLMSRRIYWLFDIEKFQIRKNHSLKYMIKNKIIKRMNENVNADYLEAFILGENNLNSDLKNSFQLNGINHLFAISGMHITVLTTIILFFLNKLFKNKIINFIFICVFLNFYLFLTGYTPSVLRATLFFVILNIKKTFNWRISNLILILLILLILLNYNPYYIYNIGFLYSFIISIGLIYFNKDLNCNTYLKTTFKISLFSFLLGLPISIQNFNKINFLTPFLNVIFVPFVSIIIFPAILMIFIFPIFSPFCKIILNFLEILSITLSKITIFTITLKTVPIYIVFLYYILIILTIKKISVKRLSILLFLLMIHSKLNYLNKYPMITMIDVGQGDSILIELPHNKGNILIDTGGISSFSKEKWQEKENSYSLATSTIIPYLRSIGIKKLDYLILTHGDYDHLGESIHLINHFKIKNVLLNSGTDSENEQKIKKLLKKKQISYLEINKYVLKIKEYQFYFLNRKVEQNENEDSLIIYTKLNQKNILLMGDAGKETENYLIREYNLPKMDILKVGHHGSKTSSSKDFINQIRPDIALISAGLNNRFGHPDEETLSILNKIDSKIYVTSLNGMIKIILKDNLEIKSVFSYANAFSV